MSELILIVIIATFIAGLLYCDVEEIDSMVDVHSKRYFGAMNSGRPGVPMTREDLEKMYQTNREVIL